MWGRLRGWGVHSGLWRKKIWSLRQFPTRHFSLTPGAERKTTCKQHPAEGNWKYFSAVLSSSLTIVEIN